MGGGTRSLAVEGLAVAGLLGIVPLTPEANTGDLDRAEGSLPVGGALSPARIGDRDFALTVAATLNAGRDLSGEGGRGGTASERDASFSRRADLPRADSEVLGRDGISVTLSGLQWPIEVEEREVFILFDRFFFFFLVFFFC
jgi:hypothetical protein